MNEASAETNPTAIPTLGQCLARGIRGRCPRCGEGRLFRNYLKPVERCAACGEAWGQVPVDDFAPYATIFVSGFLLVPSILASVMLGMPYKMQAAFWIPVSVVVVVLLLPRCKGAIFGLSWSIANAPRRNSTGNRN